MGTPFLYFHVCVYVRACMCVKTREGAEEQGVEARCFHALRLLQQRRVLLQQPRVVLQHL